MGFPLGNAISLQGFTLTVGMLMGGTDVTLFSTYRTLTRFPFLMMNIMNNTVWTELSNAFGIGNIEKARRLHHLSVGGSIWSVLVASICLFFIGGPILKYWTHGQIPFRQDLFLILQLVTLANAFWYASSIISVSTNRHEKKAVMYVISSILALVLSFPLGIQYGLSGIAVSLLLIDVAMPAFVLRQSITMTNDTLLNFIYSVFVFPVNLLNIVKQKLT
jgi:O-antigen/teichoic acid export membrane protein